jgi:hypothetical protein
VRESGAGGAAITPARTPAAAHRWKRTTAGRGGNIVADAAGSARPLRTTGRRLCGGGAARDVARRCREPGRWQRGGFDQIEDCRVTGTVSAWGLRSDGVRFPEHASADHFLAECG